MTGQASGRQPGLGHAALLYSTPAELDAGVTEFVRDGARDGEPVLVACSGPSLQRLRSRLDDVGPVTWTDLAGAQINPRRITAAIRAFAEQHPGRPVRCVQELVWYSRSREGIREMIRHEALINLVLARAPVAVLCGYGSAPDAGPPADAGPLASVERTHPFLAGSGPWRPNPSYAGNVTVPPECDEPLTAPPLGAVALRYRDNQASVRDLAADQARRAGMAPDRVRDLVLAVGELAINTLAHTSGPGTFTIWAAGGEVICQVQDSGHITDPLAGTHLPSPLDGGGARGLWVVNQLCDLVEIRTSPEGTTVRVHLRLGT